MSTVKKAGLTFILLLAVMHLNLQEANAAQVTLTSSQTWTVPDGVNSLMVEVWGGGGGGASSVAKTTGGGGGGGGAYSAGTVAVTPGNVYTVSIGAGGAGGTAAAQNPGQAGGITYFSTPTTVSAVGGAGGPIYNGGGGTGGAATSGYPQTGGTRYSGGDGFAGATTTGGGGGSSAGTASNGTNATSATGAIAPAGGGNGGNGRANATGLPGSVPGGGGGGAEYSVPNAGGAGASGQVRITYTPPTTVSVTDVGGINPPDQEVCTGTDNVAVDTFGLWESTGNDDGLVNAVEVTVNDWTKIRNTYVKDNDGASILCQSLGTPGTNTILISGCSIIVPGGLTTPFKIYFDMNGATSGTLTATVTNITLGPNGTVGTKNDTSSAVISMNTAPPARITTFSATPQPGQVYMIWTNPTTTDLQGAGNPHIMLRRQLSSFPTTTTAGDLIMDDTAPVPGATVETNDSTAQNGVTYGYTVFSSDICGNWNTDAVNGNNAATATPSAGCMRNQPSLGFDYMAKTITASGGTASYVLTVRNLDAGCGDSTFTLSALNTPATNFDATTFYPSGTVILASGASTTVRVDVKATLGKTSGSTTTSVTAVNIDHDDETSLYSPVTTIAVTSGEGSLMHNSVATGSPYWDTWGGWGVTGGRYGEFVCETCHTKSAPNIKGVKGTITAPTWTTWASNLTYTVTPDFRSTTTPSGFGDDSTNHDTSTKVCEVCHSQTKFHRYNATSGQTSTTHYNAQDCTKCHSHNAGFDPVCNSCHGIPPTRATLPKGGPDGLANDPAETGSGTVGSHEKHGLNLGYSCVKCHNGYDATMGEAQPKIDIGFSMFGKDGSGTTYGGHSEVTYTYRARNNTTVLMNDTRTCSNLYCHGATLTKGTNTAPQWTAIGSVTCGSCHGATAATTPESGSHVRHAGTAAGGLGLSCADCHGGTVNGHMNGSVAWVLNRRNVRFGLDATYKDVVNGSTGTTAPGGSYGKCSSVYCHSSVQGNGGTGLPATFGTPTWGDALSVDCETCHGSSPATGSHGKHVISMGYNNCTTYCHTSGGDESPAHANGTINVTINKAVYGSGANYSQGNNPPQTGGYGTCSAVYCHGSYAGGNSMSPTWGGGAVACGACHKATPADPPATGSHERHTGTGVGELHLTCDKCHGSTFMNGAGPTGHQNESVQWDLDRTDPRFGNSAMYRGAELGSTGAKAPSAVKGTCSSVYCHSNVQNSTGTTVFTTSATPTWGQSSVSCGSCHANPNTSGSHVSHNTAYANDCTLCHQDAGWGSVNHGNIKIDIKFNSTRVGPIGAYSQGSHTPGTGGFGSCSSTYCHGSLTRAQTTTMNWGADRIGYDACTICHGIPQPATANGTSAEYLWSPGANGTGTDTEGQNLATDKEVGAHQAHLATSDQYTMSGYSGVIACSNCHDVPAQPGGHVNSSRPAEVTFANSPLAGANGSTPAYDSATGRCTNVYCHGAKMPSGVNPPITNATVTWYDTSYLSTGPTTTNGDCDKCHLSPPASATHNAGMTISACNACHDHVATNGTFSDPTKHINGSLEKQVGCTTCHKNPNGARRTIVGEFSYAFGHHDNTVKDEDCVVCHMEGISILNTEVSPTYHLGQAGGNVDLRDPDTGNVITGTTGTVFRRNLSSATLEGFAKSIQDNHCLKCHDANGANYLGAGQTGTDVLPHTPSDPFATGRAPANVDAHFTTTNASFHPVKGAQNNSNCNSNTMELPWNDAASEHNLITCFDCHAASNASGPQSSTVVAHGGEVTLRKPYDAVAGSATQLCAVCHKSAVYWVGSTHTSNNGVSGLSANSAWPAGGHHDLTKHSFFGCTICHGTTTYAGVPAGTQALRAENAHGFDTRHNGTSVVAGNWASGARPWAFIRPTANFTNDWGPRNYPSGTSGQCGTAMCGKSATTTYTPGGTY